MLELLMIIVGIFLTHLGLTLIKEDYALEKHLIGAILILGGFGVIQVAIFFIIARSLSF